jgi:hypothetical protein
LFWFIIFMFIFICVVLIIACSLLFVYLFFLFVCEVALSLFWFLWCVTVVYFLVGWYEVTCVFALTLKIFLWYYFLPVLSVWKFPVELSDLYLACVRPFSVCCSCLCLYCVTATYSHSCLAEVSNVSVWRMICVMQQQRYTITLSHGSGWLYVLPVWGILYCKSWRALWCFFMFSAMPHQCNQPCYIWCLLEPWGFQTHLLLPTLRTLYVLSSRRSVVYILYHTRIMVTQFDRFFT